LFCLTSTTPQGNERTDRYIESPVGESGKFKSPLKDKEQVIADPDRCEVTFRAKSHQFAVRSVVAHQVFQIGDALKGTGACPSSDFSVRRVNDYAGSDAHEHFAKFKPFQS
jgi:hypothetical protein